MRCTELLRKQSVPVVGKKRYLLIYALAVLLMGGALLVAKESGTRTDLRMRRALAREIRNIAATLSVEEVKTLSFSAEDAGRPAFQRLSRQLQAYAEAVGLRSLYTMALRDGQLVFGPESLQPDDPYASPPGTVYEEPSPEDFELFRSGRTSIQGPVSDEYGTFISALAPVIDPSTGEVLIIVGLDVEAAYWRKIIRRTQCLAFILCLLPLAFLTLGGFIMKRRHRFAHPRGTIFRHTESVTCAVTLLMLTLIVAALIHRTEIKSREEIFHALAQTKAGLYTHAFKELRSGINLMARFFEASEQISREEFRLYCEPLLRDNPVLAALWMPEISGADAATFKAAVRETDLPDFSIRTPFGETPGETLYPILYAEPMNPELSKITGVNLYFGGILKPAIDEALRTRRAVASDPIQLPTCKGEPLGIFFFQTASNATQKGVAAFVVRPESFLTEPRQMSSASSGISVSLFQLMPGQAPVSLACTQPGCTNGCWFKPRRGLVQTVPIFAFGKSYALLIAPEPQWLAEHPLHGGLTALLSGLILTAVLTALVSVLVNRPALLEKLVQRRTRELEESETRFGELAWQTRTLLWETDAGGLYTYVNDVVTELLGYRPEELIGRRHYYDLHPEEGREAFIQETFRIIRSGEAFQNLENPVCTRRGTVIWVCTNGYPVLDEEGNVVSYRGSDTDITARREAEKNLREQEERLRTTLRSIGDAVISTDTDRRVVSLNPIAENLTGWSQAEAAGQPLKKVFRIINEQSRKPVESPADRVLQEGIIVDLANHTLLLNKNGLEIPIADSGAPIKNENGEITGVVLVFRDQTKERTARRILEESEEKYRQLFDNMTSGFALHEMLYDKSGRPADYRFLAVNPAFERLTGLLAETLIGRTVKEVLPQTEAVWIERYGKVVKTGVPVDFQEYSGSLDRWYDVKAFSPSPGCFAVMFNDITGQKKSEVQLEEYLDELERFNRSAVGRELRMVELKKEINDLCRELGRKVPYPVNP